MPSLRVTRLTSAAMAKGLSFTAANGLGSSRERPNARRHSLPGTLRMLIFAVIISAFRCTSSDQI